MTENYIEENIFLPYSLSKNFFIITEDEEVSFQSFFRLANRFANLICELGIKPNDRILVQVEKSISALALYVATIRAGCVFVPLNTSYTYGELEYFISNSKPSLFIFDQSSEENLKSLLLESELYYLTLNQNQTGSLTDLSKGKSDQFEPISRKKSDLASILYTSGTTGRSKGAMLSHENLVSNTQVLVKYWNFNATDTLLHALPIYHIHGLFVACHISFIAGVKMLFLEKYDVNQVIKLLPSVTTMMGVPTFYTRLLENRNFDRSLVKNMRLFISGSAPLLAETHEQFEQVTGHKILERYGMSETNMNTSNPYDGQRKAGTVGFPLPGIEVRISDLEKGIKLGVDKIGMIEVKGDNVFMGYWGMDNETKVSFKKDGFFITGDLGKISDDGYISIIGRNKDLIISGGLNIYPKEIELVLDSIDGINETAVIGVPHKDFGEVVIAIIVPNKAKPTEKLIMSFIANKLAKFKQPKKLIFTSEIPRNAMGKVQKKKLRENYLNLFN